VKLELYESSAPPGKMGGAVSGAGPCPATVTPNDSTAAKHAAILRLDTPNRFPACTIPPARKDLEPAHVCTGRLFGQKSGL